MSGRKKLGCGSAGSSPGRGAPDSGRSPTNEGQVLGASPQRLTSSPDLGVLSQGRVEARAALQPLPTATNSPHPFPQDDIGGYMTLKEGG